MPRAKRGLTTTPTLRDEEIFNFLWRWKISSFKTIAHIFFSQTSLKLVYRRLSRLRKAGFLRQRLDESGRYRVWTLDKKGFAALVNRLPELEEYGFASENVEHDLLVNALHIGEWTKGRPPGVEIFTEQQLRRMKPEMYPDWVPNSKTHRPDGYTHIKNGNHSLTVAIEVELSVKSKDRYESTISFYDHYDSIDRILWLVSSPQIASKIQQTTKDPNFYRPNIHNFILVEDFRKYFWQARIFSGPNKGMMVRDFFDPNPVQNLGRTPENTPVQSVLNVSPAHFFDLRTSPQNRSKKGSPHADVFLTE